MLSAVFTFVKSLSPVALLLIAALAVAAVQSVRVSGLKSDLDLAAAQRASLDMALAQQNAEVDRLASKSAEQAAAVAAATADAAKIRTDADARVQRLLAARVPKQCDAAVAWGAETGAALGKRWAR